MSLPVYPDQFPAEVMTVVVAALRGTMPDPKHAAHCVWAAVGYGLGKTLLDPVVTASAPLDAAAAADVLEGCCGKEGAFPGFNINWATVIPALLALLAKLLPLLIGGA